MNFFDVNSEAGDPSCTRHLVESAAVAAARGSGTSPAAAINAMRLPAIALDQHGFVAEVNAAAEAVFDNDFRIKDRRLFVRDPDARSRLKDAIDQLKTLPRHNPSVIEPIIVQRRDKLPVIVRMRIWRSDGAAYLPAQEVCALLTRGVQTSRVRSIRLSFAACDCFTEDLMVGFAPFRASGLRSRNPTDDAGAK